jgi:antitoxin YefM
MTETCHKRKRMQAVNYTTARNNLKALIDEVCEKHEEVIITTKNEKSVVLISLDDYNRTHAQLKREVQEAIAQAERGDMMDIDEAFDKVLSKYED